MKKVIMIFSSVFWVISVVFLIFNYITYNNHQKNIKKIQNDIIIQKDTDTNLKGNIEIAKEEYEKLTKEKEIAVKDYDKWKKLDEEIISYLSQE